MDIWYLINAETDRSMVKLLFRNEERRKIAKQILETIKNSGRNDNPYNASERVAFCRQHSIPLTKYQDVLGRLRKFVLIKKEKSSYFLSEEFSQSIQNEWLEFLKT